MACRDDTLPARMAKKIVEGATADQCWRWTGATYPFGYGVIGTSKGLDGAHRVSYRLHNGEIPDGMCVLHSCDNPECCNPRHLSLGTKKDNAIDRNKKGRGKNPVMRGAAHPGAKLTEGAVAAIRESNLSHLVAAREFRISEAQIRRIRAGERWGHI